MERQAQSERRPTPGRQPIVCGVEPAGQSNTAARVAAALAERLGTRLVLVSVNPAPTIATAGMAAQMEMLRTRAIEHGQSVLAGDLAAAQTRPVLVVPPQAEPEHGKSGRPGCIVCGVDESDAAASAAHVSGRLADSLGARLLLVRVDEGGVEERLLDLVGSPGERRLLIRFWDGPAGGLRALGPLP